MITRVGTSGRHASQTLDETLTTARGQDQTSDDRTFDQLRADVLVDLITRPVDTTNGVGDGGANQVVPRSPSSATSSHCSAPSHRHPRPPGLRPLRQRPLQPHPLLPASGCGGCPTKSADGDSTPAKPPQQPPTQHAGGVPATQRHHSAVRWRRHDSTTRAAESDPDGVSDVDTATRRRRTTDRDCHRARSVSRPAAWSGSKTRSGDRATTAAISSPRSPLWSR